MDIYTFPNFGLSQKNSEEYQILEASTRHVVQAIAHPLGLLSPHMKQVSGSVCQGFGAQFEWRTK